jgi:hypothetical protein
MIFVAKKSICRELGILARDDGLKQVGECVFEV